MKSHVAIVTGGTRGIGEAISIALSEQGYRVAANYAGNHERAQEFSERTGIPIYAFDVSDYDQCVEGVQQITEDLGVVDILINNAGITRDGTLHSMDFENWNAVLQTNLSSCFNMCRCVIDGMRERGFGRIVNIGSVNGQAGQYGSGSITRRQNPAFTGLPRHWRKKVRAKASRSTRSHLAMLITDMVRAVPEKVLEKISLAPFRSVDSVWPKTSPGGVVFLVDEKASFITGSTIDINGGQHMY